MHCMESGGWDWDGALKQWEVNRHDLTPHRKRRTAGFVRPEAQNRDDSVPF